MIKALPKEFLEVISQNDGLSRYLDSLSEGRAFTPRSWLYESQEPETILQNWLTILEGLRKGSSFEQRVYQFDTSQLEKWGPQGGIAPMSDLLEDTVLPTFRKHSPAKGFSSPEWERAVGKVVLLWQRAGIRSILPVSYSRVVDDMRARDTLESNSGWPLFSRRSNPEVVRASIADAQSKQCLEYPAIALFRNYNLKTRLVWMFPMAENVFEGAYVQAYQDAMINSGYPFCAPWRSFDEVRLYITRAYSPEINAFLYATDFSKTDEHFTLSASMQVYEVLRELLRNPEDSIELRQSIERMHKIPLIISDTQMVTGLHGVSSGSRWTNYIETVFDDIFSYYVSYYLATHREIYDVSGLYGIGDDMTWISDKWHDDLPQHFAECGANVGQELNASKVSAEPDAVKTLQRLFQRGYSRPDGLLRGVYSTVRALKSAVYPERFHKPSLWSSDMFCARTYMILENCVDHPLFEEFVKFVVRGQKDLIPFAQKSSADLQRITRETKLLPGFNPTYNQEKRESSLAQFQSIRIARNL